MSWSTKARRSAGAERLEHHQEREPDRVGEQGVVLRVVAARPVDHRIGQVRVGRRQRSCGPRSQHVQRHPGDDRREPAAEVLDLVGIGAGGPQPGVLDRVVGLGQRTEHPVGDGAQPGAVFLETLGQPLLIGHVTFLPRRVSYRLTRQPVAR